jgi:glycosyltransferase involved in cell wall biosynthesis
MTDSSLRLRYFANVRLPSERANAIQIVNMCAAFAALGEEVELCYPRRYNRFASSHLSLFEHYGVPGTFETRKLFSLDFIDLLPVALQHPAFRLQSFTFGLRAVREMKKSPEAIHYIRDNATLALAAYFLPERARRRLFYEAHDFPGRPRSIRALVRAVKNSGGVVAITRGLKARFEEAGLDEAHIHVAPDGVDLDRFSGLPDRATARTRLGLSREDNLAVYTGQLFPWKGVDTLAEAAKHLPECRILFVGGRERDRKRLKNKTDRFGCKDRVLFREQVPPDQIPYYLRAADLLVLPNSARYPISSFYTSPLKLFEYMASDRPIVATDLPSLREVLTHEENALLVRPDDGSALAGAMKRLLTDDALGDRLTSRALRNVAQFTWKERASGIGRFIRTRVQAWR